MGGCVGGWVGVWVGGWVGGWVFMVEPRFFAVAFAIFFCSGVMDLNICCAVGFLPDDIIAFCSGVIDSAMAMNASFSSGVKLARILS